MICFFSFSPDLKDIMSNHSFVGCVDRSLALVQHSTDLYLVKTDRVARELYYQVLEFNFY